eukprot:12402933-Karenia_brevis.AAC.1
MFAGRPGAGAQDAWYLASLDLEQSQLLHADFIGGTLDLFKCFDQIVRLLLYVILIVAGLPSRISTAYCNYHERVLLYHAFPGQ